MTFDTDIEKRNEKLEKILKENETLVEGNVIRELLKIPGSIESNLKRYNHFISEKYGSLPTAYDFICTECLDKTKNSYSNQ